MLILGCVNDFCSLVYQGWLYGTGGGGVSKVNKTFGCNVMYPLMVAAFSREYGNCSELLTEIDFNGDGYINFREFTALIFGNTDGVHDGLKANQINCSECVGTKYYNI